MMSIDHIDYVTYYDPCYDVSIKDHYVCVCVCVCVHAYMTLWVLCYYDDTNCMKNRRAVDRIYSILICCSYSKSVIESCCEIQHLCILHA